MDESGKLEGEPLSRKERLELLQKRIEERGFRVIQGGRTDEGNLKAAPQTLDFKDLPKPNQIGGKAIEAQGSLGHDNTGLPDWTDDQYGENVPHDLKDK